MSVRPEPTPSPTLAHCEHCGLPCAEPGSQDGGPSFCCSGCRAVYNLLTSSGLGHFYRLEKHPGSTVSEEATNDFAYLDRPEISRRLVQRVSEGLSSITLHIPAIHCVACVWLLEKLYRFDPAIGESRVVFPRKQLTIHFDPAQIELSDLIRQLHQLGYPPRLGLDSLDPGSPPASPHRTLLLRLGIAGFVAGNTMLFSLPGYFGLETSDGLSRLLSFVSLALALPVVTYCAADYWRSAWFSLRGKVLSLDVPIALGIAALFGQSVFEIATARGSGYLDSLAALVFLLLVGRWVQGRAFEGLRFDRSYADYFPLTAATLVEDRESRVPLTSLEAGDRLVIRHGELIPVDGRLIQGEGRIDYSFVTGESDPVVRASGEELLAGGRQLGGAIEILATHSVDTSRLTALWEQSGVEPHGQSTQTLVGRAAHGFTLAVVLIAVGSAFAWLALDPSLALTSFVSVLIVACPCALALATPFATGAARNQLATKGLFLRSAAVLESLARSKTVVFDKTGTLTDTTQSRTTYDGRDLSQQDRDDLTTVLGGSSHPYGRAICRSLVDSNPASVVDFEEVAGSGCRGTVGRRSIVCGRREWLLQNGVLGLPVQSPDHASTVYWALDRVYRGRFEITAPLRPGLQKLAQTLRQRLRLVITSGDSPRDRQRLEETLGTGVDMSFQQSPRDKRDLVDSLSSQGPVVMVGDGLNDSAALRQSTVGIAVARDVSVFAPACDALLEADQLTRLGEYLTLSRRTLTVIKVCLAVSIAYNLIGLSFAVTGRLAPVVSAILMPLSSLTVVGLAVGLTHLTARWTLTR